MEGTRLKGYRKDEALLGQMPKPAKRNIQELEYYLPGPDKLDVDRVRLPIAKTKESRFKEWILGLRFSVHEG